MLTLSKTKLSSPHKITIPVRGKDEIILTIPGGLSPEKEIRCVKSIILVLKNYFDLEKE
jgi:hypothetical protein